MLFYQYTTKINAYKRRKEIGKRWIRLLRKNAKYVFPGRLISRINLHWPARSPDLTVPHFYLWGILNSRAYVNKSQTLEGPEENIRQGWENLSLEVQAHMVINSGGYHFLNLSQHWVITCVWISENNYVYCIIFVCHYNKSNKSHLQIF